VNKKREKIVPDRQDYESVEREYGRLMKLSFASLELQAILSPQESRSFAGFP
jgi:hypothetical protein